MLDDDYATDLIAFLRRRGAHPNCPDIVVDLQRVEQTSTSALDALTRHLESHAASGAAPRITLARTEKVRASAVTDLMAPLGATLTLTAPLEDAAAQLCDDSTVLGVTNLASEVIGILPAHLVRELIHSDDDAWRSMPCAALMEATVDELPVDSTLEDARRLFAQGPERPVNVTDGERVIGVLMPEAVPLA